MPRTGRSWPSSSSNQGGLGLDVAQDIEAKHAMQLAVRDSGRGTGAAPGKTPGQGLLQHAALRRRPGPGSAAMADQGDAFKAARDENAWGGFVEVCKSQLAFDPDDAGPLKGAEYLAGHGAVASGVGSVLRSAVALCHRSVADRQNAVAEGSVFRQDRLAEMESERRGNPDQHFWLPPGGRARGPHC